MRGGSTSDPAQEPAQERSNEERKFLRQLWVENQGAMDRTLFLASSAGVGFCTTMLFQTTLTVVNHWFVCSLVGALIAFAVSAAAVPLIFKCNARYLERLMNDPNAKTEDRVLGILDKVAFFAFCIAVVCIGAAIIIHLLIFKAV